MIRYNQNVQFLKDVAFNAPITSSFSPTPSGSAYYQRILVYPQAITALADGSMKYCGFRNGALNIQVIRNSDQAFAATWDGNADEGVKIIGRNYASNLDGVTRIGSIRALNIQARNSGTNISWVKTLELNARNDSGKNTSELLGAHIRAENYGNVYTSTIGLDIEMSDENTTQSQPRYGVQIRNTDASGMAACDAVFKISHSSTNGWANLFAFTATSGDGATAGATALNGLTTAYKIPCTVNGVAHYIPVIVT